MEEDDETISIQHRLRHFDLYEATCSVCLSIYREAVIVCRNGHSLCHECFRQCLQNGVLSYRACCPQCKDKMLIHPIPDRHARSSVRWLFDTIKEVYPFTRGDSVDINVMGYIESLPFDHPNLFPPFVQTTDNGWAEGIVYDLDVLRMEICVQPNVPLDLLEIILKENFPPNTPTTIRIPLNQMVSVLAPQGHRSTSWRHLQWIRQSGTQEFHVCTDTPGRGRLWERAVPLWDRTDEETGGVSLLVGIDRTDRPRDARWISIEDPNLQPGRDVLRCPSGTVDDSPPPLLDEPEDGYVVIDDGNEVDIRETTSFDPDSRGNGGLTPSIEVVDIEMTEFTVEQQDVQGEETPPSLSWINQSSDESPTASSFTPMLTNPPPMISIDPYLERRMRLLSLPYPNPPIAPPIAPPILNSLNSLNGVLSSTYLSSSSF